ncbi:hypothetical protein KIW84_062431 [Lathyrus oleraceus]|uniref:Uncharacterized protein n=1 Tax=Pisum sativum TaxID=3888 RepID=A0A9D5A6E7_PEA|nr:hypothetical protein KIW84_062431 [Pisum sativum]
MDGQVIEHQTLYNGHPINNDTPPKVCENKFKLLFNSATTVTKAEFLEIPAHQFKFKSILDILNGNISHGCLYDVIGCLHEVSRTQKPGNGKKVVANIVLLDAYGNTIDCTLWDDYGCN